MQGVLRKRLVFRRQAWGAHERQMSRRTACMALKRTKRLK